MNIFMPERPKIVVLVGKNGLPERVAHNLTRNTEIIAVDSSSAFDGFAAGMENNIELPNPTWETTATFVKNL